MREIKRVLWVDDNSDKSDARDLFILGETHMVKTMKDAITVIASGNLHEYDTIVFDIDFQDGGDNANEIVRTLEEKLYLKDVDKNSEFVKLNGGYLLYIYLLECGYPSDRVAFLTGNPDMAGTLNAYNNRLLMEKVPLEDVIESFKMVFQEASADQTLSPRKKQERMYQRIHSLEIAGQFKNDDVIKECIGFLAASNYEGLRKRFEEITEEATLESELEEEEVINRAENRNGTQKHAMGNTGDEMIFRFHRANLKSPDFFVKSQGGIMKHDKEDAKEWLNTRRTEGMRTRWLVLWAGNYIKALFDRDRNGMGTQVAELFRNINTDPGIEASFNQLYRVFYGMRNPEEGPRYQAISAMLIPFDAKPKNSGYHYAGVNNETYENVRLAFTFMAKKARNFCAHNFMGVSISNKTALLFVMVAMTAVLSKDQRQSIDDKWYLPVMEIYRGSSQLDWSSRVESTACENLSKINSLCDRLVNTPGVISSDQYVSGDASDYPPQTFLDVMARNDEVKAQHQGSKKEAYCAFVLSAYILKWFKDLDGNNIEQQFGRGIRIVYRIANDIVNRYDYDN